MSALLGPGGDFGGGDPLGVLHPEVSADRTDEEEHDADRGGNAARRLRLRTAAHFGPARRLILAA
ncbi:MULTISPECIES: hypothetical protein [Streptomyces]|uniref:Uncharacterized protein n=1 Tax=Streptomyces dengpaensis TaxID=2049881 RepID=A0ABN5I924_9ACTN|nr:MULTISPECIES: hypothetical protein [Streptomyces]AVH59578.1 hypothetical protein C4B68_31825 [Streptomyces dengpaensis]PIB06845.1 hypothetical protein B1C81_22500 [Streptomyces sp. HG99]